MALTDVVLVKISLATAAVTAAGFGIPMILGSSTRIGSDRFRIYTSLAGMEADGFVTGDPEHAAAASLLSQDNTVSSFVVGRRLTPVAQITRVTINTDTNGDTYSVAYNGHTYSVMSGGTGAAAVASALATAANAGVGVTGVGAVATSTHVDFTAANAGQAFTIVLGGTGSALMSQASQAASHGVAEDLADIRTAGAAWYGTLLCSRSPIDIDLAAAWTDANTTVPTILQAQTSDATSASVVYNSTAPTDNPSKLDVASVLKSLGRKRTALWWHSNDVEFLDAGITGRELPIDPGLDNWALKSVEGVTPDSLSDTSKSNLQGTDVGLGKNANIYYPLTSIASITSRGTMANGEWIDNTRFIDFLTARISEAVANLLLTTERVEYDDLGLQTLAAQVSGVLQAAKDARKIVAFNIVVPRASAISSIDRGARRLPAGLMTFTAQLSGAFNFVQIVGSVTQ